MSIAGTFSLFYFLLRALRRERYGVPFFEERIQDGRGCPSRRHKASEEAVWCTNTAHSPNKPTLRRKPLARWTKRTPTSHHVLTLSPVPTRRARGGHVMKGRRLIGRARAPSSHRSVGRRGKGANEVYSLRRGRAFVYSIYTTTTTTGALLLMVSLDEEEEPKPSENMTAGFGGVVCLGRERGERGKVTDGSFSLQTQGLKERKGENDREREGREGKEERAEWWFCVW